MFDPDVLPVPDLGFRCQRCGYPLAELTEHRCPECGRAFSLEEYIPPGGFPPLIADGEMVRASEEAVALLQRYRIPHMELEPQGGSAFGGIRIGKREAAGRLGVMRGRYLEAVDLIRRQRLGEPMPEPPAVVEDVEWTCPACGETNPGTFDLCWNCGQARDEVE